MEYLEDSELMDFEYEETMDLCRCDECGAVFSVPEGHEPTECPSCEIPFD